jgi:AcrR family transcriptional regulator
MTIETTSSEADTRERILIAAERLCRQMGSQKTTVGDIAKALRMSPANVYRFFESKKAINEGVARRLMGEVETAAEAIAAKPVSAAVRLRELMRAVHQMNAERYVDNEKLHEMVKAAMEESWNVCDAHFMHITALIGKVIAEGAASGEFYAPDAELAAKCATTAMVRFFHPQMIAEFAKKIGPTIDEQVDFILAALKAR